MEFNYNKLNPSAVWKYHYEINQIPRCSGNEAGVAQYIIDFAEKRGFKWKKDHVGSVVIAKPATSGMEDRPACVIQGHMDMVCEKNKDTQHDFNKDPIKMLVKDGWVTADGTTLGADNAIALAMGLAVMDSNDIPHPALELLCTVDEETGLTGAVELKSDFIEGRALLNIDSEEEGAFYIGCAGGQHTILKKKIDWIDGHSGHQTFLLKVEGLRGGHSGLNIHEGFGNAIILLARLLYHLKTEISFHMNHFNAGSKHNAIPREAEALVEIAENDVVRFKKITADFAKIFQEELKFVDSGVKITIDEAPKLDKVFSPNFSKDLIGLLYSMPNGVSAMSRAIEGLVETSTNLAIIKTQTDTVEILTSQRSSVGSAIKDIAAKVGSLGELVNYEVEQGGGYPAWEPNPSSKLLATCKTIYTNKFGKEPEVKAIHAGLECGIIGEKYPGMDMISFGPDIEGAHSPDERVNIAATEKIWELLKEILANIK
jgi:dipeptidase D